MAWAGHTLVQRPQMVQASVSSSCFQVKSSMALAPKDSSDVSVRLGSGFMAPLGRSRALRYMLSGEVNMCRSLVVGTRTKKVKKASTWTDHRTWWMVRQVVRDDVLEQIGQRVADVAPLLEAGPALQGDAHGLDHAGR